MRRFDHDADFGMGRLRMSRRSLLGSAAGAVALVGASAVAVPGRSLAASRQAEASIATYPGHGTWTASPHTEISFRGITAEALGTVDVRGSWSGGHSGLYLPHADGNGVSFVPDSRFEEGETVTLNASVALGPAEDGVVRFGVVEIAHVAPSPVSRAMDEAEVPPRTFRSRPDLTPPRIEITTPAGDGVAEGFIFLGSRVDGGQDGGLILDNSGDIVWYQPPASDMNEIHDVRVQEYQGEPVVTFVEANGPTGYRQGHYAICDTTYERIAEFTIANGYTGGDHHEFLLSPQGTALVGSYHPVKWDLSAVGGSKYGNVLDAIIQELEVETGRVLFEWHSLDHIGLDESYDGVPSGRDGLFDYVHQNSIGVTPDGNLVMSARHCHAIYKIDRVTGDVIWRLNGRQSDFTMEEGTPFSWQHDARMHADGELSLFDNAANGPSADAESRGLVLALDEETMTASMTREYKLTEPVLASSQGNTQQLPNGNVFIGWGSDPNFSEFTADGESLYNGRFPEGGNSYRAYRFPWTGQPAESPVFAVEADDGGATVYASWNGATEVASWQVLAGPSSDQLEIVAEAERDGFETAIAVDTVAEWYNVQALDATGTELGGAEPAQGGTPQV